MNSKKLLLIVTSFIILLSIPSISKNTWKLKKNKKGIKIYSRDYKGSSNDELKAVAIQKCPFPVIIEIMKDYNNYKNWFGMCKKLYLIKKRTINDFDMYFVLKTPVVTDRDVVVNVTSGWDKKTKKAWIKLKSIKSDYKKNSGLVRMSKFYGEFRITPVGLDKFKTEYQFHAELGGSLPSWIINILAVKQPYETGLGLIKQIKNPKYYKLAGIEIKK